MVINLQSAPHSLSYVCNLARRDDPSSLGRISWRHLRVKDLSLVVQETGERATAVCLHVDSERRVIVCGVDLIVMANLWRVELFGTVDPCRFLLEMRLCLGYLWVASPEGLTVMSARSGRLLGEVRGDMSSR